MHENLQHHFGYKLEDELLKEIQEIGVLKKVPENDILIEIGTNITHMPLLIDGAIKILREDNNGQELLLYFIEQGDTCAMSLTCSLASNKSEIRAVAETQATIILIPVQKMEQWMSKYKSWRQFILQSYQDRLTELLDAIDTIAFLKMDARLFKYLKDKAMVNHNDFLQVTHQEIATDLHTSRVVVSRLLKSLEQSGKIKMHRNNIQVVQL